ncbi:MAG TPA: pyridoxal phosphate-dependent aminotransferase family protein [Chryseosolibacter sp.]
MNSLEQFFSDELASRGKDGILRSLKIVPNALQDFTSNDYLGLAGSPILKQKIDERVSQLTIGIGATGSRLLSGNSVHHEELEKKLGTIFQADACLIFNSGYAANLGVFSSIPTRHDTILYDELCHASIKDGIRLSLATRHSFKHNDLNDLEHKLKAAKGKVFIAVESIYSMDGDSCPLRELVSLTEQFNAFIILDEAHSTGVLGKDGSGMAVSLSLHEKIAIRIYTFGKAIGTHGACVAGSKHLAAYLINFSRPFIYTTALPAHTVISISEAFTFIHDHPALQKVLEEKINLFKRVAKIQSVSSSAIQTIIFDSPDKTKNAANKLIAQGFDIRPILSPTVPAGKERLRICLHTFNKDEDIVKLAEELNKL